MNQRRAVVQRKTRETEIEIQLNLDGSGVSDLRTGIGFLDHMLELFSHHSRVDLRVRAQGDLHVDPHHLIEDVAIGLGQALGKALGVKEGIERYGSILLPMDEVLVAVAVDLSGRCYFVSDYQPQRERIGEFPTEMVEHFFRSLAVEARMNLHVRFLSPGSNEHHRVEALFKGFARALKEAVAVAESRRGEIPSTKGVL